MRDVKTTCHKCKKEFMHSQMKARVLEYANIPPECPTCTWAGVPYCIPCEDDPRWLPSSITNRN